MVYKNIFWPFSQNCQGQRGIFTISVLWVQVTLESKQKLVKKLNEFVQNRHLSTWFIQTFRLTPLCFMLWIHQTVVIHWFPWLVSNTLFFFSLHQSLYVWHPLIISCLWQNWCCLFPSTGRSCWPKYLSWVSGRSYLICEICLDVLPKLQKQDFMDDLILNLRRGFELESYSDLHSVLLDFIKK